MTLPDDITNRLRSDSVAGRMKSGPMRHDVYVDGVTVRTFRTERDASRLVWEIGRAVRAMRKGMAA